MDTKITHLRNILSPIFNYFAMIENIDYIPLDKKDHYLKILNNERDKCIELLPEIKEIFLQIPDEAIK